MRIWKYTGLVVLWIAAVHTAFGLVAGFDVIRAYAALGGGMIGAVELDPRRATLFWFLISGLVCVPLGLALRPRVPGSALAGQAAEPPPLSVAWWLIGLALAGGLAIPASGFWLFLIPGVMILAGRYTFVPGGARVEAADLEPSQLARDALSRIDYTDTFVCALPPGESLTPAELGALVFGRPPAVVVALLRLRNLVMRPFGVQVSAQQGAHRLDGSAPPLTRGMRLGLFEVYHAEDGEVLLGLDDSHLNFRVSLVRTSEGPALATHVQMHNLLGRAYFFVVKPFHKLIVPAMMRAGLRCWRGRVLSSEPLAES